jgi:hypothetical protein
MNDMNDFISMNLDLRGLVTFCILKSSEFILKIFTFLEVFYCYAYVVVAIVMVVG